MNSIGFKNYFDFLWAMTEKEIKVRYKRAMFGFFWIILNPLLQMLIIGLIFSFFIKIPNYFLFLFSGLLLWQFFSLSVSKTTPSFIYERSLLQKAKFPKEAIPISIIISNFFNLLISLILLLSFLLLTGNLPFQTLWLLFPALIWLFFLTIGLSLLTSSLNVRYRDINFFVQSTLILWFYATPILYNLTIIPRHLLILYYLNPLTTIFEISHIALINQGKIIPSIATTNLAISLIIITIGVKVYKKNNPFFVDWI
ncbi:ABC transporter permease [Patescibacteria group bacterium]|nr:ABC transporter permease [Patescibacteria group bacterium]